MGVLGMLKTNNHLAGGFKRVNLLFGKWKVYKLY